MTRQARISKAQLATELASCGLRVSRPARSAFLALLGLAWAERGDWIVRASQREIADAMGVASVESVRRALVKLEEAGLVRRVTGEGHACSEITLCSPAEIECSGPVVPTKARGQPPQKRGLCPHKSEGAAPSETRGPSLSHGFSYSASSSCGAAAASDQAGESRDQASLDGNAAVVYEALSGLEDRIQPDTDQLWRYATSELVTPSVVAWAAERVREKLRHQRGLRNPAGLLCRYLQEPPHAVIRQWEAEQQAKAEQIARSEAKAAAARDEQAAAERGRAEREAAVDAALAAASPAEIAEAIAAFRAGIESESPFLALRVRVLSDDELLAPHRRAYRAMIAERVAAVKAVPA